MRIDSKPLNSAIGAINKVKSASVGMKDKGVGSRRSALNSELTSFYECEIIGRDSKGVDLLGEEIHSVSESLIRMELK